LVETGNETVQEWRDHSEETIGHMGRDSEATLQQLQEAYEEQEETLTNNLQISQSRPL